MTVQDRIRHAVELTRQQSYDEALVLFEQHLQTLSSGDLSDKRVAAAAFSFYGVCVAVVKRRYADAVKFCNLSLKANFLDPEHRANLALVYLERNERQKAVETLNAGLRLQPDSSAINRILDRIGRRRQPAIAFLSRDNPLNVWLGKRRQKPASQGRGRARRGAAE